MRSIAPAAILVLYLAVPAFGANQTTLRAVEPREVTASEIRSSARDSRNLVLRTAIFDPATERPDFTKVGLPGRSSSAYAILQFQPGQSPKKAELEKLGVRFLGYLSEHAYQVHVPAAVRNRVGSQASVRWLGDLEPGFKVHPRLWPSRGEQILAIRVMTFANGSVSKTVELLKRATPGLVVTKSLDDAYAHFVEVAIPAGSAGDFVRQASSIEGVAWIEPNDGMKFHNSTSSGVIQGNLNGDAGRTFFAHNITGTGQIVAVADSGLDSDMCFFRTLNGRDAVTDATSATTEAVGPLFPQNKVIGYWVQEDAHAYDEGDFHGTHTAGSVAGDDLANPSSSTSGGIDSGDGMAPNAQILFQDIGSNDGKLRGGNPYAMFLQALQGGARVHSNSYGTGSKGAYTAYDQLVDQYLFDHDEMTVVFSAGNEGPGGTSTGSPGNAKNVVTVGAVGSGLSMQLAIFSSHGPTTDGRIKPDIVAPGQNIRSAGGDANRGNGNCGVASKQGTSMSAPTVAGGATLLRQYFADGFYPTGTKTASNGFNASATLVKAVLLNGTIALPAGQAFGNMNYGWGKIFLDNNVYFPGDARKLRLWDLPNADGLATGDVSSFTVSVAAGQEFRATLVWTDPEGTPGAAKALVNDLDLSVTNSAGTFLGNVYSTAGDSTTGGSADRLNNVEQIRFGSPAGGTYTITVRAASVPGNGRSGTDRQGFALAVSAANCSGTVSAAPSGIQARTNATRGIDLTWTPAPGATVTQIYRGRGANPAPADFKYIGSATGGTFTDSRAQGGYLYSYILRSGDDCSEGPASSPLSFLATGLCDIAPTFSGVATAQAEGTSCKIVLTWGQATSNCPLGSAVRYNVYRSTSPNFAPQGAPYATTSATTFSDIDVVSGTTYYYVVRAEDTTTASSGPNQGNQEANEARLFATAVGPPGPIGTWRDGAGDGGAFMVADAPWQLSFVEGNTGTGSYHNGVDNDLYQRNTCASLTTPAIPLDANAELAYFVRYNLEWEWDGIIVEISDNDGATWAPLPPSAGYPGTLAQTQGENGTQPPANSCGDLKTTPAFTGPSNNAGLTPWTLYSSSLASFAGKTVKIRWRFTSDPGLEFEGFYLDDITITNAKLATACASVIVRPAAAFQLVPGIPSRGKPVSFQDKSSGTPTSWLWEFGDGKPSSTLQNPTHTFDTAGTFQVKLTVTNAAGTTSVTQSVTVEEPNGGKRRRSVRG
jgi:hypothetical protein